MPLPMAFFSCGRGGVRFYPPAKTVFSVGREALPTWRGGTLSRPLPSAKNGPGAKRYKHTVCNQRGENKMQKDPSNGLLINGAYGCIEKTRCKKDPSNGPKSMMFLGVRVSIAAAWCNRSRWTIDRSRRTVAAGGRSRRVSRANGRQLTREREASRSAGLGAC